jgi:NADH dehydrogenase FAD-containing subunit
MSESDPCVVIVGGGFAGLAAARALKKAAVRIILIDRTNHHLFQPLLYQVATAVLAPGQISSPIREILRRQKNTTVIMGEVTGVDKDLAWLAWAAGHLEFLAQPGLRISVFVQWIWTFVTGQRGSRLIVDHTGPGSAKSIPAMAASTAPSSQPPVTAVVSSK